MADLDDLIGRLRAMLEAAVTETWISKEDGGAVLGFVDDEGDEVVAARVRERDGGFRITVESNPEPKDFDVPEDLDGLMWVELPLQETFSQRGLDVVDLVADALVNLVGQAARFEREPERTLEDEGEGIEVYLDDDVVGVVRDAGDGTATVALTKTDGTTQNFTEIVDEDSLRDDAYDDIEELVEFLMS